jgi:hypothetical protein
MDGKTGVGGDRFDEVVADMNNSYMAVYGLARLLAQERAPEMATRLDAEVERYETRPRHAGRASRLSAFMSLKSAPEWGGIPRAFGTPPLRVGPVAGTRHEGVMPLRCQGRKPRILPPRLPI